MVLLLTTTRVSQQNLGVGMQVLGDLCMDNLEPSEFEKLEETAGKPTYLYYLRCVFTGVA